MKPRLVSYGVLLLMYGGYLYGFNYLVYMRAKVDLTPYFEPAGYFFALAGILLIAYGILAPEPIWFIRTGDEVNNIACDYRESRLGGIEAKCRIRIEREINDNLLREIMNYLVKTRRYEYLGLEEYYYLFHRKPSGLKGLWSKSVDLTMFFESLEGGATQINLVYNIGLFLNPFLRGETLYSYIEAEVYGLYRHIRSRWSKIYGEEAVEKMIYISTE